MNTPNAEEGCRPHGLLHCTQCREAALQKRLRSEIERLQSELDTTTAQLAKVTEDRNWALKSLDYWKRRAQYWQNKSDRGEASHEST